MPELSNHTHEEILRFSAKGDELAANGGFEEALAEYNKAWEILPEPKDQWNASLWLLAAMSDACFLGGFSDQAYELLKYTFQYSDALGNPFLHLRYGQVLYDRGDEDFAIEHLMRAYMGEGVNLFSDEDPKYLKFLGTRANL